MPNREKDFINLMESMSASTIKKRIRNKQMNSFLLILGIIFCVTAFIIIITLDQ